MASAPRVVAELGRPETPEETASRKAAASAAYRSSQNFRNLIAALLVTLAVVAVIVFAVPRGSLPEREPIDVAAAAAEASESLQRPVLAPEAPAAWRVNDASLEQGAPTTWTILYAPPRGFLRVAQAFDADAEWASRLLGGRTPDDTVEIGGIVWQRYDIPESARVGNVARALATTAGTDAVVIYGSADAETTAAAAEAVAAQLRDLQETP
ncbi:DUF4245 family protein [Microbacterium sp.]|uniref:DUF4245 family protein n=1 Tax=Microbacterium sp. TaxID=51671 RepID=UPI0039E535E6